MTIEKQTIWMCRPKATPTAFEVSNTEEIAALMVQGWKQVDAPAEPEQKESAQ